MDPATMQMIAMGLGAAGGLMGDGSDKNISMTDIYGKQWAPEMRGWRDDVFAMEHPGMYPGQTFAPMDPAYEQALLTGINYGDPGGFGYLTRQNMLNQGTTGMDALTGGMNLMGDIQGGTFGQDIWNQTMSNLMPGLPGAFDAATRDDTRNFFENIMPGINTAAAGTGNMASSRAGVAEGIAQRGYQDRLADVGSQLWMNAANMANRNVQDAQSNLLQGYADTARMGLPGFGDAYKTDMSNLALKLAGGEAFMDQNQLRINEEMARHMDPYNTLKTQQADIMNLINMTTPKVAQPMPTSGGHWLDRMVTGAEAGGSIYDIITGIDFGGSGAPLPETTRGGYQT